MIIQMVFFCLKKMNGDKLEKSQALKNLIVFKMIIIRVVNKAMILVFKKGMERGSPATPCPSSNRYEKGCLIGRWNGCVNLIFHGWQ